MIERPFEQASEYMNKVFLKQLKLANYLAWDWIILLLIWLYVCISNSLNPF